MAVRPPDKDLDRSRLSPAIRETVCERSQAAFDHGYFFLGVLDEEGRRE